jgi:hypothetical protein
MAKHGQNTPTRMKRLKSARKWIASYRGKNLVRGYKKRFGVSDVCAVVELRMMGVNIPDARLEQARRDECDRAAHNTRRKQKRTPRQPQPLAFGEWEPLYAFIAGYEDDAPYGITWEGMEVPEARTETPPNHFRSRAGGHARDVPRVNESPVMDDDDDLPF